MANMIELKTALETELTAAVMYQLVMCRATCNQ